MSYIRSGSNPEGLYIFGDGEYVTICIGPDSSRKMPKNIFHGLIRKYHRDELGIQFKGASLNEEWIEYNGSSDCKVVLAYDNWRCEMWGVTWDYIAYTNLHNINRNSKSKIIIK